MLAGAWQVGASGWNSISLGRPDSSGLQGIKDGERVHVAQDIGIAYLQYWNEELSLRILLLCLTQRDEFPDTFSMDNQWLRRRPAVLIVAADLSRWQSPRVETAYLS